MDYQTELKAMLDRERTVAASMGAECVAFGLVLLQPGGCVEWFNRFHRDFAQTVAEQQFGKTIGVVGITQEGRGYVNEHSGCERYRAALRAFFRELCKAVPDKSTRSVRLPISKLI